MKDWNRCLARSLLETFFFQLGGDSFFLDTKHLAGQTALDNGL